MHTKHLFFITKKSHNKYYVSAYTSYSFAFGSLKKLFLLLNMGLIV